MSLPSSIDWRVNGAVTPVKNAGSCNEFSWAFAAAAVMESADFIKTNNLKNLSEQQLINCIPCIECNKCNKWEHTCTDHKIPHAFKYAIKKGIESAANYPYTGTCKACSYDITKVVATFTSFSEISQIPNFNTNLMTALVTSPIVIAIKLYTDFFTYSGGVYAPDPTALPMCCEYYLEVVGYDTLSGQDYFICKNSMGVTWGISGYIYIARPSAVICRAWTIIA